MLIGYGPGDCGAPIWFNEAWFGTTRQLLVAINSGKYVSKPQSGRHPWRKGGKDQIPAGQYKDMQLIVINEKIIKFVTDITALDVIS